MGFTSAISDLERIVMAMSAGEGADAEGYRTAMDAALAAEEEHGRIVLVLTHIAVANGARERALALIGSLGRPVEAAQQNRCEIHRNLVAADEQHERRDGLRGQSGDEQGHVAVARHHRNGNARA